MKERRSSVRRATVLVVAAGRPDAPAGFQSCSCSHALHLGVPPWDWDPNCPCPKGSPCTPLDSGCMLLSSPCTPLESGCKLVSPGAPSPGPWEKPTPAPGPRLTPIARCESQSTTLPSDDIGSLVTLAAPLPAASSPSQTRGTEPRGCCETKFGCCSWVGPLAEQPPLPMAT